MHCLAKALYDNVSEAPDELTFKKGDILTVLEQNSNGLEGWWLCSLKGRQGIAPGNRLRLIPGRYDSNGLGYAGSLSLVELQNLANSQTPFYHSNQLASNHDKKKNSYIINPNLNGTSSKMPTGHLYSIPPVSKKDVYSTTGGQFYSNLKYSSNSANNINLIKSTGNDLPQSLNSLSSARPRRNSETSTFNSSTNVAINIYDLPPSIPQPVPGEEIIIIGEYDVPPPLRFKDGIQDNLNVTRPNCLKVATTQHSESSCSNVSGVSDRSSLSISNYSESSLDQPLSDLSLKKNCQPTHQPKFKNDLESKCVQESSKKAVSHSICSKEADHEEEVLSEYDIPPNISLNNSNEAANGQKSLQNNDSHDFEENKNEANTFIQPSSKLPLNGESGEPTLDEDEALQTILKLETVSLDCIDQILKISQKPNWRAARNLSKSLPKCEKYCKSLRCTLQELIQFGDTTFANSLKLSNKSINMTLYKLVLQLKNSQNIIESTMNGMNNKGWTLERLAHPSSVHYSTSFIPNSSKSLDELDQLIACIKGLIHDIKHIISYIKSNSKQLFNKPNPPLYQTPTLPAKFVALDKPPIGPKPAHLKNTSESSTVNTTIFQLRPLPLPQKAKEYDLIALVNNEKTPNDYDYIVTPFDQKELLEQKDKLYFCSSVTASSKMYSNQAAQEVQNLIKNVDELKQTDDGQMLQFYFDQLERHKKYLTTAINSFMFAISRNESPRSFIAQSKCVVIAGQNLIFIGDTLSRHLSSSLSNHYLDCCNSLCDSLKNLVVQTKKATLHFPSVTAIQEMLESLIQVSIQTDKFRVIREDKQKQGDNKGMEQRVPIR